MGRDVNEDCCLTKRAVTSMFNPSFSLLSRVRRSVSRDIYLPNQNSEADDHCYCDDWQIDTGKFETAYMYVFSAQDVAPEHTSKGCAKGQAEGAVVDSNCHTVNCSPEGPV
jgi:hypothetical protein